ncbi:hypothetical protein A1O3_06245 [Capronia epimyces CBS 606.96]|uniref:Major facilitator superfamily (MFS) profile domain-containing protein n=1 Tax=Capronia epimyces CBS 606.96 TaxID=1182542 RepID=W9XPH5_9EURO|nr:uncharacterized protein A1O3_06245 [Capronia epimyces CBS 606.96]EXJ82432.1 hypothetical protein A1O3_06245 [Capronia epimyces CBS 606.96]
MTDRHGTDRRASSDHQPVQRDDLEETASLLLSRTRSEEDIGFVENIAVQDPLADESKSLLGGDDGDDSVATAWPRSISYLIMLSAFLTSLSFGVTQVPMLYVFRLMTCDAYYKSHPAPGSGPVADSTVTGLSGSLLSYMLATPEVDPTGIRIQTATDRCAIHAIESSTALSISLLGASTTIFGLLNLFVTTSLIKRIGVKPTLIIQVFFPAVRLLVQNVGIELWGSVGIIIIQASQVVSIAGGPSGYLLVLNTFITEVVDHEHRTAALGRLTGSMMSGSASGFLLGGVVAEFLGIKAPYRLTFILFLSSCAFAFVFLPHIPPPKAKESLGPSIEGKNKPRFFRRFVGPLSVFAPRKFIGSDGVVRTEYGPFLLAWGVFLGILATGYLPTLLQLYSTNVFGFGTKKNGWLIFMHSMLRGVFLTFAFPKLIAVGRRWTAKKEEDARARAGRDLDSTEREPLLSSSSSQTATADSDDAHDKPRDKEQTFKFDLTYTRFSLIADGLLTLLCSFVHKGWQMYLVAVVLPFAAGTGSAAKGTILQMIGSSASSAERADALAGISLVENMARLSTTFVFGVVFAFFASIGRTELVFTVNAAVALIGFTVVLFARFPPEGSRRLDHQDEATSEI